MNLYIAFILIATIVFLIIGAMTSPSEGQRAIERRLVDIRASGTGAASGEAEVTQILKVTPTSSFSWLERMLEQYKLSRYIENQIMQADSKTTVGKLLFTSGILGGCAFLISHFLIPLLLVQALIALVFAYGPFMMLSMKRNRRINAFNKALPDAIDMMGRALRAGHSMVAAINIVAEQAVAPVNAEFSEVFKQQNFGLPLRDALMQMVDHVPSQDLRVVVTGILVQRETGGNLAEILDRTVFVIRERLRIQGEIRTHTAQGRLTGWILCSLPIVMLILINIINPGYSSILLETPTGHKLIILGIVLLSIGGLTIRWIINGIEV
jgi:tight adherence protein B